MATTLVVSGVDDEVARRLEARAEAAGRSVEAEHRAILDEALGPKAMTTGWDLFKDLRATYPLFTDEEVETINRGFDQADRPVELPE